MFIFLLFHSRLPARWLTGLILFMLHVYGIMLISFETKIIILNNVKGHVHANPVRNHRHRVRCSQTAVCANKSANERANEQASVVNFRFCFNFLSIVWHWNHFNRLCFFKIVFQRNVSWSRIRKQNEKQTVPVEFSTNRFYIKIWRTENHINKTKHAHIHSHIYHTSQYVPCTHTSTCWIYKLLLLSSFLSVCLFWTVSPFRLNYDKSILCMTVCFSRQQCAGFWYGGTEKANKTNSRTIEHFNVMVDYKSDGVGGRASRHAPPSNGYL